MTKREIYKLGFERGFNVASWTDLPEIGEKLCRSIDWAGIGEITTENVAEAFEMLCHGAESNGRDFSPFEFTAHQMNELEDKKPYDVWEIFDNGIAAGIRKNWKARKNFYK